MTGRIFAAAAVQRLFVQLLVGLTVISVPAQPLLAATCSVVKHNPPSEADKALLAMDYVKAEGLYKSVLAAHPGDVDATVGLVHALLGEQKLQEAADAVKTALAATPNSASLLTSRGEVEFAQGEPWVVEQTVLASYKLDPCNPRTRLLYARFAEVNSRYATARQQIGLAHQFDPQDPEIRAAWIDTLPLADRVAQQEASIADASGESADTLRQMRADLDRWKKEASEATHACTLVSTAAPADIPFVKLAGWAGHTRAFGLEVGLNGVSQRLQLGAGEGGITLFRAGAEHAGLKRISASEPGGPGGKPTYSAYADSIKIGNLEFKDCAVRVVDGASPFDNGDGLIGMDVFSDFLVTLDYPMRKVQLGALPLRQAQTAAAAPSLKTASVKSDRNSLADRYVSPEMKDYTQIYRVGDNLILPAALNAAKVKLFILDLGAGTTSVAPEVAKDVSKVSEKDVFGHKTLVADEITFNFAHLSQKVNGVTAMDTSMASRGTGMNISGFIGANTFSVLIMHIDYRDGLVKFEFIPDRGYKFE